MPRPSVSVVVPCYGYGSVLEGCVRSVLAQEDVDVQVLVIDDCSPDATPGVARALAAVDARVEYHRQERNRGLISTVNHGLELSRGDYVAVVSADDLLTPGSLARAAAVMERLPRVGLVYGRAPYWHEDVPMPATTGRWRGTTVWRGRDWIATRCRSAHNCISSPEVVVRAKAYRAAGPYDPRCTHASDLNMWLRIAAVADVAYVRGVPQAIYRVHGDSMLRSTHSALGDLRERRMAFDAFFSGAGARLPDAPSLRAAAAQALARQALWQASRAIDRGEVADIPVDDLVAFALDVDPGARRLREWHGHRVRRRLGAGRSRLFVPFLATGAAHRVKGHVARARWAHTGL
jgi:glycosyltransferase involved in cell wall biosynthesis